MVDNFNIPNGTGLEVRTAINQALNKDNVANGFVVLDADGKLPAIDGSLLTNLPGGSASYETEFTIDDVDVVSGDLTVTHNLGSQFNQVAVYDENNLLITPDSVTATDTNTTLINIATSIYASSNLYLHLNDSFNDSSGNNATVTLAGSPNPELVADVDASGGYCAKFTGTSQLQAIQVNDNVRPRGTEDFTISFRIKFIDFIGNTALFHGNNDGDFAIGIFTDGGKKLHYFVGTGSSWDIMNNLQGSHTLVENTWYHIAFTRKNGVFYAYIDGALDMSVSGKVGVSLSTVNAPMNIGYWGFYGAGVRSLKGYLDEFYINRGTALWFGSYSFAPPEKGVIVSDIGNCHVKVTP